MAKVYTAQEMRQAANLMENEYICPSAIAMLRQAADAIEREDKREKEYEYKAQSIVDGTLCVESDLYESIEELKDVECISKLKNITIVRRPVGEWEAVKDA